MGQNNFSPPTGDHPSEQSARYSSTQRHNIPLDNPNLSSDQFDGPPSQVSPQESASGTYQHCTNKIWTRIVDGLQDIYRPQNYKIRRISDVGGPALTITAAKRMDDSRTLIGT